MIKYTCMRVFFAMMCCSGVLLGRSFAQDANGGYDYPNYEAQMKMEGGMSDFSDGGNSNYNPSINDFGGDADSDSPGIWPSMSYLEMLGPMKYEKGDGHAKVTNWTTLFDFVHMSKGRWSFNADGAFRMSWIDGSRDATLDVDRLFTIWTNLNMSYRLFGQTRLVAALTPQWSSDFDSWVSDNFFLGGNVMLTGKLGEKGTYVAGFAYAPQLGDNPWIPYIGGKWKLNDRWTLDLMAPRFSLKNKVSDGFTWGPFISVMSGTWTVKRNRHHERFEWRSCLVGVSTETGLGQWGKVRPKLLADVGMSCWNRARFKSSDGDTDYDSYRFKPGFYVRVGLQFGF